MASTYSNLKIQLMATGENSGTWGNVTNVNLGTALEQALVETATVSVSSGDATLTLSDTNARQDARALRLNVTGASVARVVNVPAIEKPYLVNNAGSAAVTVKVSGQTGIAVPAGKTMWVYNNGTDVVDAITHLSNLNIGGTLSLSGTNVTATAAELNYVDGVTSAIQTQLDNKQALDADLTAIAALANTDGNFIVGNGSTWVAESGATARTSLGLGSMATQNSGSVSISGGTITGITDLAVADGGTGASTLTANNVLLGNGTSAVQFVAPGSSGNVLTSNGTTWTSAAAAAFDSGTVMLFAQTSAPSGWTKNTSTGNNHALRIVTGSASSGGSVDFSTAFASQSVTGTVTVTASTGQTAAPGSLGQTTAGGSISVSTGQTAAPVSVGNTTLSTPQIPSHNHPFSNNVSGEPNPTVPDVGTYFHGPVGYFRPQSPPNQGNFSRNVKAQGGGGSHTHPGSGGQHSHPASGTFTGTQHAHPFTGGQHAHPVSAPASFSGTAINLAVKYVDVIRASKD